mmetsp:Transcript_62970/g.137583  ORF Transcript_62970/g.137583 Transcript_62970/m.137583 type:complete len:207 (+) Transcript_62970:369-989(+)
MALCTSNASRYCCFVSFRFLMRAYSSSSIISSSLPPSRPLSACFRINRSLASSIFRFALLAATIASFISAFFSLSSTRFFSNASSKACPSRTFQSAKADCLSMGFSPTPAAVPAPNPDARSAPPPPAAAVPAPGSPCWVQSSWAGRLPEGAMPTLIPRSSLSPTSPSRGAVASERSTGSPWVASPAPAVGAMLRVGLCESSVWSSL